MVTVGARVRVPMMRLVLLLAAAASVIPSALAMHGRAGVPGASRSRSSLAAARGRKQLRDVSRRTGSGLSLPPARSLPAARWRRLA